MQRSSEKGRQRTVLLYVRRLYDFRVPIVMFEGLL